MDPNSRHRRLTIAYLLGAFALLAVVSPVSADEWLALKARWYDHDYGAFNGEFSATTVAGCSLDVNSLRRGMVQDTLRFDPAKGKKIPRMGAVDNCSKSLEKWFDPAEARSATCGNLFFRNVGDSTRPVWRFDQPTFFPLDSLSPQSSYVLPSGSLISNDFAYCMEINAALTYKGGETLKIRGDDDTWVFLDGVLVMDQGGIHFALQETLALDTLPSLKGKQGRTLDLDVYYCSRQPGTAVFGMEAAAELKPLIPKSLRISDTTGRAVGGSDILVGKSRLCARVLYQDPGEEACGNYQTPPDLGFLDADWDLNGTNLSIPGGQACLDLDPAVFPHGTRINLTAKSGALISRVAVTLLRPARPLSGLLAGQGKVERVELLLDTTGGPAPDGLRTEFEFAGVPYSAQLMPDSADPWLLRGRLAADRQGPFGTTGFFPVPAVTFQSIHTHVSKQQTLLSDGVGPVLAEAWFRWGVGNGQPAYLDLQVSESLRGGGDSLALGLAWRRSGKEPDPAVWAQGIAAGENRHFLYLTASAARAIRAGDSVSLSERVRDGNGNRAEEHWLPIRFPRIPDVTVGEIRLRENPARGRQTAPEGGRGILIPVGPDGSALPSSAVEAHLASQGGPVLEIPLLIPLARVRLAFFDHLGNFVNAVDRAFSEAEWESMRAASPGDTTLARLLWHPVSARGGRLATGAYVLQGEFWTRDGLATGPDGDKVAVKGARHLVEPRLFGFLRN